MVSAFHYAEEWTSSSDTWEGKQSGPVGSERAESRRIAELEMFLILAFQLI